MRHVPVFRWLLALGLALIGCSLALFMIAPGFPELRQVDLTVLEEAPDGTCTVRWTDPYGDGEREAPYRCDAGRDPILKAPAYDPDSDLGWDTGFVIADGPGRGELYSLEDDAPASDRQTRLSDATLAGGLLLTVVGLVGGNIRALYRLGGARPDVVRRATLLRDAAESVAHDHERAVDAVRSAWFPLHRASLDAELGRIPLARLERTEAGPLRAGRLAKGGVRTVRDVLDAREGGLVHLGVGRRTAAVAVAAARLIADEVGEDVVVRLDAGAPGADAPEPGTAALLSALRVLVEAGPGAGAAAAEGRRLAVRLEPLLTEAAPARGHLGMLRAGPEQRRRASAAVAELRLLLAESVKDRAAERFAQASVDLLRGPDGDPTALAAAADFESRPAEYYGLLADVADTTRPARYGRAVNSST
ncbi:hypothetical protein [Streptomyces wuyuanensis]|uniref:hypothetical protein n=1 Tax=Streptomyces wuyuanensis TaxID=1196353 RepID=UPI0037AC4025